MKYIETVSISLGMCLMLLSVGAWLTLPHAQNFVAEIHKKEEKGVVAKLDSLIVAQLETQRKIDKIIYVMVHALPEDERKAAIKKYKEYKSEK